MKPDGSVLKNKIVIENYHLLSLDGSRKGGGVACFIKHSIALSYKANICLSTESLFTEIHLPKS